MQQVILARHAMATRFEIVLHGSDPKHLQAAGEEALDEIERIEALLSFYKEQSEIHRLNCEAGSRPVRVSRELFAFLEHALTLSRETGGAFDLTIAPLMRCWGFVRGTGAMPSPDAIEQALEIIGHQHVHLDGEQITVWFDRPGIQLDPGAIGKGYAVDRAVQLLRDAGIDSALIHGGTSTVYGIGNQMDGNPWNILLEAPLTDKTPEQLGVISLRDSALSVSAVWGKAFQTETRSFGHVIDPRNGWPGDRAFMTALQLESAAESDALSTALLVLGKDGIERIRKVRPFSNGLVLDQEGVHHFSQKGNQSRTILR
ncbi:MAG: FAD:protein FMN transferase [Verrucomicrobiota bacterium]|nr:FAD:protein FMN transferase [Verrucomicrobiota bacterium]